MALCFGWLVLGDPNTGGGEPTDLRKATEQFYVTNAMAFFVGWVWLVVARNCLAFALAFLAPLLPDAWLPSLERLVACALGVTVIYWVYRSQQAFEAWCAHSGSERPVSRVEESASRSRVRHAQRRELKRTGSPAAKGKGASEQALWPPRLQRSDDENPAAALHAFNDDRR